MGRQFGSQILEHFSGNDGKTTNGVEVVSVVLGIETNNFDSSIRSFAANTGFDFAGVDCMLDGDTRSDFREGFSYYTGLSASRIPNTGLRRTFLVLNGLTNSPSHKPWEVLYNDNSYRSSQRDRLLATIDSIMPGAAGPTGITYPIWAAEAGLPLADDPLTDTDGDGLLNGVEFYFDSLPKASETSPLSVVSADERSLTVSFPVGRNREGVTIGFESSEDLENWTPVTVSDDAWAMVEGESRDQATVTLPSGTASLLRLAITVTP